MKPARRHREPFVEATHARKDQKRRLGGFTKPPKRFGEELSWGSNTMMLVIVLSQYHTVYPMLLTMGNPLNPTWMFLSVQSMFPPKRPDISPPLSVV